MDITSPHSRPHHRIYGIRTSTKMSDICAIARWEVIPVYISNTWSCCNCMNDHDAAAWSPELLPVFIGPPWLCCNSCMIMQQLQLHWLIHLFTKLGGPCALWLQPGSMVLVWTEAILHIAKNNCHWLADPKPTICEPKCIYTQHWGSKIPGESSGY